MKKLPKVNTLEDIESALDRIACSLASISGIMDNIFMEIMKEKRLEEKVSSDTKDVLANQPGFDHPNPPSKGR